MRNILFVLLLTPFILTSCIDAGGNKEKEVSSTLNDSGYLVSKKPIDFDEKFGYKVLLEKSDTAAKTVIYEKVLIPKKLYEKMPSPKDNLKIKIYFLRDIEYGQATTGGIFWDFRFNLVYGYIEEEVK